MFNPRKTSIEQEYRMLLYKTYIFNEYFAECSLQLNVFGLHLNYRSKLFNYIHNDNILRKYNQMFRILIFILIY